MHGIFSTLLLTVFVWSSYLISYNHFFSFAPLMLNFLYKFVPICLSPVTRVKRRKIFDFLLEEKLIYFPSWFVAPTCYNHVLYRGKKETSNKLALCNQTSCRFQRVEIISNYLILLDYTLVVFMERSRSQNTESANDKSKDSEAYETFHR